MSLQPTLDFTGAEPSGSSRPRLLKYEREWLAFHEANPAVYAKLVEITLQVKRSGREHFGIRAIWERMRWYFTVEAPDPHDYKLNDHYTRFYARRIMADVPRLKGFFEVRGE